MKVMWYMAFSTYLLTNSTLSTATVSQIVSRVQHFAKWMDKNLKPSEYLKGNKDRVKKYGYPSAADDAAIEQYFSDIYDDHPADYRQHIKTALRHYYAYLVTKDAIKDTPDLDVTIRKNDSERGKDVDVVTDQQVDALKEYFDTDLRNGLILQCLAELGLRKGELLMLRYSDFKHSENQVTFRSTKTEGKKYGGARMMPLSNSLSRAITKYHISTAPRRLDDGDTSDLIFSITGSTVWRIIKTAGKKLGMPWLRPHYLRHYCITKFSQIVGSDQATPVFNWKELSVMFGVSPEVIAQKYDHPDPKSIVSKALKSLYSNSE
jgi:integrase